MTTWREAQRKLAKQVSATYANNSIMWHPEQPWSWHVHQSLKRFIQPFVKNIDAKNALVLNCGSGNNAYGLPADCTVNIDLFHERVYNLEITVVNDVSKLSFRADTFDHVLCVGSVLAYSPLIETIREIERVLKERGTCIFHFESSTSGEFIFTTTFGRTATVAATFNDETSENAWVYRPKFVEDTLNAYGFVVIRRGYSHVLSALMYRITKKEHFSCKFAWLDRMARRMPVLRGFAENIFIECQKTGIPFVETYGQQ